MFLQRFFTPRPQVAAGRSLFTSASNQARTPEIYSALGAPDTYEGRFEVYTLHVALVLRRLRGDQGPVVETRQALFDAFVRNLDDGLREMGVGDLSVGKKMRKLGSAVYGRLKAYDQALQESDAVAATAAVIGRTMFDGVVGPEARAIAAYTVSASASIGEQPLENLLAGTVLWPKALA